MLQLSSHEFEVVRPLFYDLKEHLIIQAVIDGSSPGKIYVDDNVNPTAAFLCSVEGYFLVGDPNNKTFVTDLAVSSWQTFDLNVSMATAATKTDPLNLTVTFRAVAS